MERTKNKVKALNKGKPPKFCRHGKTLAQKTEVNDLCSNEDIMDIMEALLVLTSNSKSNYKHNFNYNYIYK